MLTRGQKMTVKMSKSKNKASVGVFGALIFASKVFLIIQVSCCTYAWSMPIPVIRLVKNLNVRPATQLGTDQSMNIAPVRPMSLQTQVGKAIKTIIWIHRVDDLAIYILFHVSKALPSDLQINKIDLSGRQPNIC